MEELIKALTILSKYNKEDIPFVLTPDMMICVPVDRDKVTEEDNEALEQMGVYYNEENGGYLFICFYERAMQVTRDERVWEGRKWELFVALSTARISAGKDVINPQVVTKIMELVRKEF